MNYKPFDLEAAKAGHPIVTRSGKKARFIAHVPEAEEQMRVVFLFEGSVETASEKGEYMEYSSVLDLFMATLQRRTAWVNLYRGGYSYWYDSEQEADMEASVDVPRIGDRAYMIEIED